MSFSIFTLNRWHLSHPWTLPVSSDLRLSLKGLSKKEKVLSLVVLVAALPLAIIGGLIAFFAVTGYFKTRLVRRLSLDNPSTPPVVVKVYEQGKQQLVNSASKEALFTSTLDPTCLTEAEIRMLSPDEQGALIDTFARRNVNAPSNLSNAQLRGMVQSNGGSMRVINTQERGKGYCGRYCINNALQQDLLSEREFLDLTAEAFHLHTGMAKGDVEALIRNDEDFAIDTGIIAHILQRKWGLQCKIAEIGNLPDLTASKQRAMENFIGSASYVLVGNTGGDMHDKRGHSYDMPSLGATYPLASGHFVALRKDGQGRWWYIDSRMLQPVQIALAVIPKTCTLIVFDKFSF